MTDLTQNQGHIEVLRKLRKRFAGPADPFVRLALDAAISALEREDRNRRKVEYVRRYLETAPAAEIDRSNLLALLGNLEFGQTEGDDND